MVVTSRESWMEWLSSYSSLPYIQEFKLEESRLVSWERLWEGTDREVFVLESGKGGRYTILGMAPVSVLTGKGNRGIIRDIGPEDTLTEKECQGNPLHLIRQWMAPYEAPKVEGAPKFTGGCVGYLGYDVVRHLERLPELAEDDLGIPDYVMLMIREVWVVDHQDSRLYCCVHTPVPEGLRGQRSEDQSLWVLEAYDQAVLRASELKLSWDRMAGINRDTAALVKLEQMNRILASADWAIDPEKMEGLERAFPKAAFMEAVERIRNYIAAGDVFQVNLSVRQSRQLKSRPEGIYEWLRLFNPSPYMAYLRFKGFDLVSASPELLVQLEDQVVRTRPIAGTRKRGASPEEDRQLRDELLHNEKERAEHIMLVDLERNDLGRVSRYGSVKVTELMAIEYYSHVMHIVSEITGELADGKDGYDVLAAAFPGGTITGAPKVRTMEIIEELEPVRRGLYTGSIGWIDYNGNLEFNIVIRTLLAADGKAYVQAGAGIVIDSVPEREYKESLNKAKALWKAVEYSEQYPF